MSNMNPDPQTPTLETTASLLYTERMAMNRAGAPTVDPDGAPVSDGWRARWCAEQVVELRQHAAQMERDLAVALGADLRDGWVGLLSLVRKQGAGSARAATTKVPEADVVADLQGQLDQITEVHKALDEVKAPPNERLVERVRWLGQRLNEAWLTRAKWLEEVRQALNVGPPSDSDVKPDASAKRLVEIVRARSVLMLDERDQRVALAQEVEALKRQAGQEHVKLIARLDGWMSGDETNVRRELEDQVIRAVEAGGVTAHDAINALRHRRSLAELVLAVDFGDNDIPF